MLFRTEKRPVSESSSNQHAVVNRGGVKHKVSRGIFVKQFLSCPRSNDLAQGSGSDRVMEWSSSALRKCYWHGKSLSDSENKRGEGTVCSTWAIWELQTHHSYLASYSLRLSVETGRSLCSAQAHYTSMKTVTWRQDGYSTRVFISLWLFCVHHQRSSVSFAKLPHAPRGSSGFGLCQP